MADVSAPLAKAILIDQLPVRRAGLAALLSTWAGAEALSLMPAAAEALTDLLDKRVRIVLFSANGSLADDAALHGALALVRLHSPRTPVALLSDVDDPNLVRAASAAGFDGYVPSSLDPQLAFKALSFVLAGGSWFPPEPFLEPAAAVAPGGDMERAARMAVLTSRQQEIVQGLKRGDPNKVIARKLNISEATVKIHVRQIMRKLGVSNRTQVALSAPPSRDHGTRES